MFENAIARLCKMVKIGRIKIIIVVNSFQGRN